MGLMKWTEKKIHGMTLGDFAIFKIALALFGVIIGAYISAFVQQYIWYFIVVFVVLYAVLMYRVFGK